MTLSIGRIIFAVSTSTFCVVAGVGVAALFLGWDPVRNAVSDLVIALFAYWAFGCFVLTRFNFTERR